MILCNHGKGLLTEEEEEETMMKEQALDMVIRSRGFEDVETVRFANLLDTLTDEEAMEMARKVASLPFDEE